MTDRLRPLLLALVAALLLATGGAAWISLRFFQQAPGDAGAEGLLDLLYGNPGQPSIERRPQAPKPPRRAPWRSPLAQQCPPLDPALQAHLLRLRHQLSRTVRNLRIHPTNFGERFTADAFGSRIDPRPRLIVLHETVYGLESAINTFITPHPRDEDQVSYHSLVGLQGELVRSLDPTKRAFGAGNSSFNGEWVVSNPSIGGSINNFALHLSLETPIDGENAESIHSGYTSIQYDVLAVEMAHWMESYAIPPQNITTHRHVDNGGERADPRSFDWSELANRLRALGHLCG